MDGVMRLESAANVVLKLALAELSEGQATAQMGLDRIDVRGLAQAMESLIRGLQVGTVSEKQIAMRECLRHLVGVASEEVLRLHLGYSDGKEPSAGPLCDSCAGGHPHITGCPEERPL